MALESYYFNISTRKWVRSFDEPTDVDPPVFGNTDARDFDVTFLKSIGEAADSPVQVVQAVVSAQIAISDPATPGTPITSATASTAVNNAFPFVLAITGFTSFLSGVTTPKAAAAEFRITTAAGVNRYGTTIYIRPNQLTDVTADTTAADRALGANEAAGVYLAKEVQIGTRMIWTDETNGVRYSVGFINGQFVANHIT